MAQVGAAAHHRSRPRGRRGAWSGEPVGAPLPDVAATRCRGRSRWARRRRPARCPRSRPSAVFCAGKRALPDVAAVPAAGRQLVAPGEARLVEAAAGGVLPLGLGRQALARPMRQYARRRSRRRGRRGGRRGRDVELGPSGWRQSAPCTCRHQGAAPTPRVGGTSPGSRPAKTNDQPKRSASVGSRFRHEVGEALVGDRARRWGKAPTATSRGGPSPSAGGRPGRPSHEERTTLQRDERVAMGRHRSSVTSASASRPNLH